MRESQSNVEESFKRGQRLVEWGFRWVELHASDKRCIVQEIAGVANDAALVAALYPSFFGSSYM